MSCSILALGAWFKNRPCLLDGGAAVFGPALGDLDDPAACRGLEPAVAALLAGARHPLAAVAHDLHPDFPSTHVALATAQRFGVPTLAVQHHHAHIAAVLAEHDVDDDEPVLGLALDGVGLGSDGTAWGGELLQVAGARCARMGRLRPLRLPGGDRAAREPWRMAAALLHACGRGDEIATRFAAQPAAAQLAAVLARPALCPPSSSLGRHFDAAAGLLGVCAVMTHEAEAAIALERLASAHAAPAVSPDDWCVITTAATPPLQPDTRATPRPDAAVPPADAPPLFELDLHPLLLRLADETDAARGAARFHATLAAALIDGVAHAATMAPTRTVVLGGGCLHNQLLARALHAGLAARGFNVLGARQLSPGDAGIALGQAWVARHQLAHREP